MKTGTWATICLWVIASLWGRDAVVVAAFAGLLLLLALFHTQWAANKARAARGYCPKCGYDIRATPKICPECGTKFFNPAPRSQQ